MGVQPSQFNADLPALATKAARHILTKCENLWPQSKGWSKEVERILDWSESLLQIGVVDIQKIDAALEIAKKLPFPPSFGKFIEFLGMGGLTDFQVQASFKKVMLATAEGGCLSVLNRFERFALRQIDRRELYTLPSKAAFAKWREALELAMTVPADQLPERIPPNQLKIERKYDKEHMQAKSAAMLAKFGWKNRNN